MLQSKLEMRTADSQLITTENVLKDTKYSSLVQSEQNIDRISLLTQKHKICFRMGSTENINWKIDINQTWLMYELLQAACNLPDIVLFLYLNQLANYHYA